MVHPICHLFFPNSLLPLVHQNRRKQSSLKKYEFIGFHKRSKDITLDGREENDLIQISVLALRPQQYSKLQEQDVFLGNEEEAQVLGLLVIDDQPLEAPPSWAFIRVPSIFITLRATESSVRVERLMVDTVTLNPNPHALFLFHYPSNIQTEAVYLCSLPEEDTGLPSILIKQFNQSCCPEDLIFLQENSLDKDPGELKSDPFGNWKDFSSEEENAGIKARLLGRSMGAKQLMLRINLISEVFHGKLSVLGCLNFVMLLVVDILLGILISKFLQGFPHLYSVLHAQIHILLKLLLQLLNWLRGSPAGLKLNTALNSLLWRFFSYHLHLWSNYIGILEPILSLILSTIIWVGPLGLTFQLSLMKDLLSMATFHVYCLYIYATRLYRMLMVTIMSLGRLFLGRKWNPLRSRVDHVHLSISELFLSALFFTIAIFLAPTVIIYYVVFLSLRLPVVLVETTLGYLVDMMNGWRLVTSQLIILNKPRVCDQIYVEAFHISAGRPPEFHIRLQSKVSKFAFSFPSPPLPVFDTIKSLIRGEVLTR